MMTKWDTIQADVADAYVWMDEELAEEENKSFFGHDLSLEELAEDELELDEEYN